jgi:hypothetical protein
VPVFFKTKLSPHQIGLCDVLATLELLGKAPKYTAILGVQPRSLALGMELSPEVENVIPTAAHAAHGAGSMNWRRLGIRFSREGRREFVTADFHINCRGRLMCLSIPLQLVALEDENGDFAIAERRQGSALRRERST